MGNLKKEPDWLIPGKLERKSQPTKNTLPGQQPRPQMFFHPQGLCRFHPMLAKRETAPHVVPCCWKERMSLARKASVWLVLPAVLGLGSWGWCALEDTG